MFDSGAVLEDIKHHLNHLYDAQTMSHMVNLAVQCIGNRAECKLEEIHLHLPEWFDTEVPISARKAAAPWLHEATEKVKIEKIKCTNMKDMKSRCLVTAMGCLEALDFLITRLMQFSVSYLDYSDMENAELCDYPAHWRSLHPILSHNFLEYNVS